MNQDKQKELKKKRKLKKKVNTYHHLYKRKGVYPFLLKNSIKLVIFLVLLIVGLMFLEDQMPDLEYTFELFTNKFRPITILAIFLLSESFLGLIPPDFFLVWAKQFSSPYGMVALLAVLSYGGGVISYFIGNYIGHIPSVERWMYNRFLTHIDKIKKWGGVLIVFAALFPLPFSPICMAAGMVRFPFLAFLLLGLFRFARIFGYALILFKVT
jgi:membrane protein YqaA with SNARE-associated domain